MPRNTALKPTPLGDTDSYTPSKQRPVRVRARSMPADTHFEPHAHPWAQLAYCATGIVQVTAAQASQSCNNASRIAALSLAAGSARGSARRRASLRRAS